MALTKGTWAINTIQSLATRTKNQATAVKQAFDKAASDIKTYINNTLTVEIDALDAANVKKTGNQTIDGVKTFTSSPIVPVATSNTEAVQKVYVDNKDTAQTGALNTHKTSSDHDGRYYTETELDSGQLDNRYFTETELSKTTATSGAELIGSKTVSGVTGNTVWAQISSLYTLLVNVVLGQVIDRSLTYIKIALGTITNAEIASNTILESNMAAAMKKQAGGVAGYDTVAAHLTGNAIDAHAAMPCCYAYHSADQSIAPSTYTTLAFNSERFDTDTMHDLVTNNERITCKTAGKYDVDFMCEWLNTSGGKIIKILLNGVTLIGYDNQVAGATISRARTTYNLAVNDYIIIQVWHNHSGAVSVYAGTYSPQLIVKKVG